LNIIFFQFLSTATFFISTKLGGHMREMRCVDGNCTCFNFCRDTQSTVEVGCMKLSCANGLAFHHKAVDKNEPERLVTVSFASSTASSSLLKVKILSTDPNISSLYTLLLLSGLIKIVG
jgi:hypothetical protein